MLPPPKYDDDEAPTDAFPHDEQINTDPKFNDCYQFKFLSGSRIDFGPILKSGLNSNPVQGSGKWVRLMDLA